jgi:hypothetical protein
MSSWQYHRDLVEAHYQRYVELQEEIAALWEAALRATRNRDKRAAWVILLKKEETQHGFNYMRLTNERTQLIQQITMHSSMATMFWMTEPDQPARIPTQVDRTLES